MLIVIKNTETTRLTTQVVKNLPRSRASLLAKLSVPAPLGKIRRNGSTPHLPLGATQTQWNNPHPHWHSRPDCPECQGPSEGFRGRNERIAPEKKGARGKLNQEQGPARAPDGAHCIRQVRPEPFGPNPSDRSDPSDPSDRRGPPPTPLATRRSSDTQALPLPVWAGDDRGCEAR